MRSKTTGPLYWFAIVVLLPSILYLVLLMIFGRSFNICLLSFLLAGVLAILFFFLDPIKRIFRRSKKDREWGESESGRERVKEKTSAEEYTVEEEGVKKKEKGLFSRLFGGEEECEECGAELEYREESGAYYCPNCQEYKWR